LYRRNTLSCSTKLDEGFAYAFVKLCAAVIFGKGKVPRQIHSIVQDAHDLNRPFRDFCRRAEANGPSAFRHEASIRLFLK
jgi:hypothetical protein